MTKKQIKRNIEKLMKEDKAFLKKQAGVCR